MGAKLAGWVRPDRHYDNAWLPGRWIGGISLLIGPAVLLAGLVVRHVGVAVADFSPAKQAWLDGQTFAAPRELAAYAQHPDLVTTGYTLVFAGSVLVVPAILTFGRVVARGAPRLAYWGALLFALAQFARVCRAGVDLTAFQLVDTLGLDRATDWVLDNYADLSYGFWRVPMWVGIGSFGSLLLVAGAYRAGVFGVVRCLLLFFWGWVWMGVLKQAALVDAVGFGVAGVIALLPVGVQLLRGRWPDLDPTERTVEPSVTALRVW
jgi:hypothetical protein